MPPLLECMETPILHGNTMHNRPCNPRAAWCFVFDIAPKFRLAKIIGRT